MSWPWMIWVLSGYLCGSVPVAWLIGRAHGVDIRRVGSGNVGATNLGRALGRRWGAVCLLLDVVKGAIPVAAAGVAMAVAGRSSLEAAEAWHWLAVAVAAVLGHVFPIWLRFRGGKGVATGLGVLLGLYPLLTIPTAAALLTWLLAAAVFRYVSLASVLAALLLPVYLWVGSLLRTVPTSRVLPFLVVTCALALLVLVRHRSNLVRLAAGTEPRLGAKRSVAADAGAAGNS
jgi:glycerol-3-phosphate acyltransferase PlsY